MSNQNSLKTVAQWKKKVRKVLWQQITKAARAHEENVEPRSARPKGSTSLRKATLVFDPITLTVEDVYGGTLTCTYNIRRTLSGLQKELQQLEVSNSEIAAFAKDLHISFDEAQARVAVRYVEAEIFSVLRAGRFLHDQFGTALKETLNELLDAAFLRVTSSEYGCEIVEPASTAEKYGRKHLKFVKQLMGSVPPPGRRPETGEAAEQRIQTQKVNFIARFQKAERDWYASGHRDKPRQVDLAVLLYGNDNRESAASRFSRQMKKHGLTLAEILQEKAHNN